MIRPESLAAALILAACLAGPLAARQVNVPSGNPIVGIDVPAGWKTDMTDRGIEAKSPDDEVFFWVEVYLPADSAAIKREHAKYFAAQGVKPIGEAKVSSYVEGDVNVQASDFPATWNGAPTVLRYLSIDAGLPAGNTILLSYWASPEGDKKYAPVFKKALDSLGAPK